MLRLRVSMIAVLCFLLSACAGGGSSLPSRADQSPAPLPPTVSATNTVAITATRTATSTRPPFVTATPTPVVVPSLPGPATARIVAPQFNRLPDTQTISDAGDPKVISYLSANWSHFQQPQTLCSESETPHVSGASSFITPTVGWMLCGRANFKDFQVKQLYKTEDGGIHWTLISETTTGGSDGSIPMALPDGGIIGHLSFVDADHGWLSVNFDSSYATSDPNSIYSGLSATADGGRSWKSIFVTNGRYQITAIAFKTSIEGYLSALDPLTRLEVVLATQDGGMTWTQPYPAPAPNNLWHFIDMQHGVGSGTLLDPAAVLTTEDGGVTWRQVGSLRDWHVGAVFQMTFPDQMHGWAVAYYHPGEPPYRLFRTTDGGATWKVVLPDRAQSAHAAFSGFLLDAQTGYAFTADERTWITHDGGETFQPSTDFAPHFSQVPAIRAKTGQPNLIFQLYAYYPFPRDNGWAQIPLGDEVDGLSIEGTFQTREILQDCDRRQARGCQILLFVSVNGGEWTRYDLGAVLPLRVQFDGSVMRWMGRPAGPLYRTDDGGQTWTQIR